jgi:hypothetical protein
MEVSIVPWLPGSCACYAIKLNGIVLPEQFVVGIEREAPKDAERLAIFLRRLRSETYIRPQQLRSELPNEGVYAMYDHKPMRGPYNPVRLLCSYVSNSNRILLVGGGFYKTKTQPIQQDAEAMEQARLLVNVVRELHQRIDAGEIQVEGSELLPRYSDSLQF